MGKGLPAALAEMPPVCAERHALLLGDVKELLSTPLYHSKLLVLTSGKRPGGDQFPQPATTPGETTAVRAYRFQTIHPTQIGALSLNSSRAAIWGEHSYEVYNADCRKVRKECLPALLRILG